MSEDNIIIRFSEVLSVDDDKEGLRIKVKLPYEDADCKYIEDLPYAFPLLPKMLHVNPKVGECVMIILQKTDDTRGNRFFIGPVISQQYMMNKDPYNYSSRSLFEGQQIVKPLPKPSLNPENEGTVPDRDTIAIIGRKNCDLQLLDDEIRIRCGHKKQPDGEPINTLLYNEKDLAYIQMRYEKVKDAKGNEINSMINVVADRINLLSHDSPSGFKLGDNKNLINDEQMNRVLNETHPMVYGDELVKFLKELIEIFRMHSHPFSMDPPILTLPQNDTLSKDLNTMLSPSIRLN